MDGGHIIIGGFNILRDSLNLYEGTLNLLDLRN